ncbi:hypothetical protein SUDANB66_00039 [Streptomyces sp. SudanB66_2053]
MLIVTREVTGGANSRRTVVRWSHSCTCAGMTPSSVSPRPSGYPSAPPTPTPPRSPAARRAGSGPATLREHDPDFVLLDGTLAECDRVGDGRADYSAKHKRHGVNVQVVTGPAGEILWLSPALPGRTHDLTAARTQLNALVIKPGPKAAAFRR